MSRSWLLAAALLGAACADKPVANTAPPAEQPAAGAAAQEPAQLESQPTPLRGEAGALEGRPGRAAEPAAAAEGTPGGMDGVSGDESGAGAGERATAPAKGERQNAAGAKGAADEGCYADCLTRNQMRAVAIEVIERDCRRACDDS